MAKHRFHTLEECESHKSWMVYSDYKPCYLRYVFTIPGTVEAYDPQGRFKHQAEENYNTNPNRWVI